MQAYASLHMLHKTCTGLHVNYKNRPSWSGVPWHINHKSLCSHVNKGSETRTCTFVHFASLWTGDQTRGVPSNRSATKQTGESCHSAVSRQRSMRANRTHGGTAPRILHPECRRKSVTATCRPFHRRSAQNRSRYCDSGKSLSLAGNRTQVV
jgi:hypothetical protein